MRKVFGVILVFAGVCFLLTACGVSKNVPEANRKSDTAVDIENLDNSFSSVKERGKVIVGGDPGSFPFCFADDTGVLTGFDVDLATAAAQIIGIEVEFKKVKTEDMADELNSGGIDLMWGGAFINTEIEDKVLYSKPYAEDGQAFFVLKESDIEKIEDLKGKTVAAEGFSSNYISTVTDKDNVKLYKNIVAAVSDLETGKIDAVFQGLAEGMYYTKENRCAFRILHDLFYEKECVAAARYGDKALMAEVDSAIQKISDNKTAKAISEKWFGDNIIK